MAAPLLRSALGGVVEFEITEADARAEWAAARQRGRHYWSGDLGDVLVLWERAADGSRIAPVIIWRPDGVIPAWHVAFFGQFVRDR